MRAWAFLLAALLAACSADAPGMNDEPDAGSSRADARGGSQADARPGQTPDAAAGSPDAAAGTADAAPGSTDDPVVRLTPEGVNVTDFDITSSDLVVNAVLGTRRVWRCPLSGCPATPVPIATPNLDDGGSIATGGGYAFFVEGSLSQTLKRIKLDGTVLETAAESPLYSRFSAAVVSARGRAYVGYVDPLGAQGVLEVDGSDAFPLEAAGTSAIAGEVAAGTSWLVYAPHSSSARPFQVWSFADLDSWTTAGITFTGSGRALAVAGDVLFWAEDDTLRACDLGDGCEDLVTVLSSIQDRTIATDGTRVYFGKFTDGKGTIPSCPAAAAACTPRVESRNLKWLQPRRIRVDASYVYGVDQLTSGVFRFEK